MLQPLLAKIRKNQSFAVVTAALLLVLGLTAVQQTEMLPLRGQSTPIYNPLKKTQKTSVKRAASSVRSSGTHTLHHAAPVRASSRSSSSKSKKSVSSAKAR